MTGRGEELGLSSHLPVLVEIEQEDLAAVTVVALAHHGHAGDEMQALRLIGDPLVRLPRALGSAHICPLSLSRHLGQNARTPAAVSL
jgi:hypothetical protein